MTHRAPEPQDTPIGTVTITLAIITAAIAFGAVLTIQMAHAWGPIGGIVTAAGYLFVAASFATHIWEAGTR